MARQRAHHLSLLQVPQLERAPRGARDDHLLGVVERHALHRGLMARERQDRGGLANGPQVDLLVVAAGDHDAAGLAPDLEAVDRGLVRIELLRGGVDWDGERARVRVAFFVVGMMAGCRTSGRGAGRGGDERGSGPAGGTRVSPWRRWSVDGYSEGVYVGAGASRGPV